MPANSAAWRLFCTPTLYAPSHSDQNSAIHSLHIKCFQLKYKILKDRSLVADDRPPVSVSWRTNEPRHVDTFTCLSLSVAQWDAKARKPAADHLWSNTIGSIIIYDQQRLFEFALGGTTIIIYLNLDELNGPLKRREVRCVGSGLKPKSSSSSLETCGALLPSGFGKFKYSAKTWENVRRFSISPLNSVQRSINNRQVLPQKKSDKSHPWKWTCKELEWFEGASCLTGRSSRSLGLITKMMEMQWDNSIAGPSAINHTPCTSIWITSPHLVSVVALQVRQWSGKILKSAGCGGRLKILNLKSLEIDIGIERVKEILRPSLPFSFHRPWIHVLMMRSWRPFGPSWAKTRNKRTWTRGRDWSQAEHGRVATKIAVPSGWCDGQGRAVAEWVVGHPSRERRPVKETTNSLSRTVTKYRSLLP